MSAYVVKFATLGIPVVVALLWWRRAGVLSRRLYTSTWTNVAAYPMWLGVVIVENRINGMDKLIGILIALPLIAVGCCVVLAASSHFAKRGERMKMATANLLMLMLWVSSLIAPN